MSRYYRLLIGLALVGVMAGGYYFLQNRAAEKSSYVNSILAIRGFRHAAKSVSTGQAATYEVNVGEETKVTWKMENAIENGQVLYQGPTGIGAGIVAVPLTTTTSQSASPFLTFTPRAPGLAQFSLTVTGPGPEGIYTLISTITVTIK